MLSPMLRDGRVESEESAAWVHIGQRGGLVSRVAPDTGKGVHGTYAMCHAPRSDMVVVLLQVAYHRMGVTISVTVKPK